MKKCSRCKENKEYSGFTKNGTASDGYYSMCKDCKRHSQYYSAYGITKEDYELLLEVQDSKCAICGVKEKELEKGRLYVDHSHSTGKVRGLLCSHCNFTLGQAKDSIDILLQAIQYLEIHNEQ